MRTQEAISRARAWTESPGIRPEPAIVLAVVAQLLDHIDGLTRMARGEPLHVFNVECQDQAEGLKVRDPDCPACQVLKTAERLVAERQDEIQLTCAATLGALLGQLRLREVVLLYVGTEDAARFSERLHCEFGSEIADQALRHLFVLNNAPLPEGQRESLRAVFDHGMSRW